MNQERFVHPEYVPSAAEYAVAFKKIEPRMTENQRRMLIAHHDAPCWVISAQDLAKAVDFEGMGGANLWYGKLGQMLSEALGFNPIWAVASIVLFLHPGGDGDTHWVWVMRQNVVEALEALGWAPKTSNLFFPNGDADVEAAMASQEGETVE